jgi:hypothetical protein
MPCPHVSKQSLNTGTHLYPVVATKLHPIVTTAKGTATAGFTRWFFGQRVPLQWNFPSQQEWDGSVVRVRQLSTVWL